MKFVCSFVSVPFLASNFSSFLRRVQARAGFAPFKAMAAAALASGAVLTVGQAAHVNPTATMLTGQGTQIQAIAVDAKGDVYFSVQSPYMEAFRGSASGTLVPAAYHPARARRQWDGQRPIGAQLRNAASCTYNGALAMLFMLPANSRNLVNLSGLNAPYGVALDAAGDLYALDAYSSAIYEYPATNGTVNPNASPVFVAAAQGDNCTPGDLATDARGDLYYTTSSGNSVEEMLAVNGVIPPSPTVRTLGSGFSFPVGIAVDGSGNVYVADAMNNAVKEMLAVNGSIPSSPTIRTLGSGFSLPAAVAVDGSGDVYVADLNHNELKEMVAVNGSVPTAPTIENLGSFTQTQAVTLDGNGDVFVGEAVNNSGYVMELTQAATNFGQVNIGAAAAAIPLTFTFDSGGTLGGISVLTEGAAALDFANAGTGSCVAHQTYSAGQSCTVSVSFTPKLSGTRNGAVVLTGTSGNGFATAYLSGSGVGPQVNFQPGTASTVAATGLSGPSGVAVDGSGNVYLADTENNRVLKETLAAGAYTQSTVTSDVVQPHGVAVDGSGAVYVADTGNNRVLKETPAGSGGYAESTVATGAGAPMSVAVDGSGDVYFLNDTNGQIAKATPTAGGYAQSTIVSGLSSPAGLAVDGEGNLYVADSGNNRVVMETPANGSYAQSVLPANGMNGPAGVAVDGTGNVYIVFPSEFLVMKETPAGGSYTPNTAVSGLNSSTGPFGVAVDGSGNLYIGDEGNNQVLKEDFVDAPGLSFASTVVGSTSTDGPQTVTVGNDGNATLTFPIPSSGSNPSVGGDFTLSSAGESACVVVTSDAGSAATLTPGASCELEVSFAPAVAGSLAESLTLTDTNLNAAAPGYATQAIGLSGTAIGGQTTPTITWATPAAMTYGTALGAAQLDATASVQGTFSYSPGAGTVLSAGTQTLTVTFTPTDTTDYTTATATATLTVNQAAPVINWSTPAAITYGTALGAAQLDASSTVAGTFAYSPSAGAVPGAGTQTLTVTFTPTDTTDYTTATASVSLTVNKAMPAISWNAPAAITYGTALGAAQLDASSTVAGTFAYSPSAGAVPGAGTQTLTVTFTPTDTTDYTTATASVSLTVNKATPAITWNAPAAITYGTALSAAQLDASSTVAGTFAYSPSAGAVPGAGTQTLTVTFTPTDTTDYTTATASVSLTVNKATPAVTWPTPGAIVYGTALSGAQLDASSSVAGSFAYSPASGAVLPAGAQTLSVTFTPTDTSDYNAVTTTVLLTVNKATPTISWPTPAPIVAGTPLSSTQLDASASVSGTFAYSPAAGTVLAAGSQTLTTVFTPTDTNDYNTANGSVVLQVTPAPSFTLSTSSGSLSVTQGKSGTDTVTVNDQNGFHSSVTLSASGLPSGVTVKFGTNPSSGSSVLTFTASSSAATGTFTVTVKGVSGSLSASTTISLTIKRK